VLAREADVIARALEDQGVDHVANLGRQIEEGELFVLIRLRLQHKDVKTGVGAMGHENGLHREGLLGRESDVLSKISLLLLLL